MSEQETERTYHIKSGLRTAVKVAAAVIFGLVVFSLAITTMLGTLLVGMYLLKFTVYQVNSAIATWLMIPLMLISGIAGIGVQEMAWRLFPGPNND